MLIEKQEDASRLGVALREKTHYCFITSANGRTRLARVFVLIGFNQSVSFDDDVEYGTIDFMNVPTMASPFEVSFFFIRKKVIPADILLGILRLSGFPVADQLDKEQDLLIACEDEAMDKLTTFVNALEKGIKEVGRG